MFASTETIQRFLKPIANPALIALYRQMETRIFSKPDDDYKEQADAKLGWMSPEAIQTDLEGIYDYFLSELDEVNDWFREEAQVEMKGLPATSKRYSHDDIRQLLQLLKKKDVHVEVMQVISRSPHLLRDPDVRNFIDGLFFRFGVTSSGVDQVVQLIEASILEREKRWNDLVEAGSKDDEYIKGEFEAILYLADMHEKLSKQRKFDFTKWLAISQKMPILANTTGYIARLMLRERLLDGAIKAEDLQQVVTLFLLANSGTTSSYLLDPYFESYLKRAWESVVQQVGSALFESEAIHPALDQMIHAKNLPLDDSPWVYQKNGVFTNSMYSVDCLNFSVLSLKGSELDSIPDFIFQASEFRLQFDSLPKQPFAATVRDSVYAFTDLAGLSCRLEMQGTSWTLYKQAANDKWLRLVPQNELQKPNRTKSLFDHFRPEMLPLPAVFRKGIYIDPQEPLKGYRLDGNGNIQHTYVFTQTSGGLCLDRALDADTPYTLNTASDFGALGLEFLYSFENPNDILLWSQNGKLKKVELSRYGLTFSVNDRNELITSDGYIVVANPKPSDKKYLQCALVLKHPDPTKSKKLLVPTSDALTHRQTALQATAKGIGRIILMVQNLLQFVRLMRGDAPRPLFDLQLGLDDSLDKISYSTFDLRAYTEEICFTEDKKVPGTLLLAQHLLAQGDFGRAYEAIKRLSFTSRALDSTNVNLLLNFIMHTLSRLPQTGGEAALKLKLAFELKRLLKKENPKKAVIQVLNTVIMAMGKSTLQAGRSLPRELQLTEFERIELARIAKRQEPEYYEKQLKIYFTPKDQRYEIGKESDLPDGLDAQVAEWKKRRSSRDREQYIADIERAVMPNVPLTEDELKGAFTRLAPGKEFYRLFRPDDVAGLFKQEYDKLPDICLKKPNRPLARYEEQALADLQQELADYKKEVEETSYNMLSATREELDVFVATKVLPLRNSQDASLELLKNEVTSLIHKAIGPEEQLEIYSGKKSIASFDELRMAFGLNKLEFVKEQGRLSAATDVVELKKLLHNYFEALVRKNALDASLALIDKLQAASDVETKKELSKALYYLLTVKCAYDASSDPRFLIFEAQRFITFKSLDAGLDQLQLLETLVSDPFAIVQAPTAAGKTSVLGLLQTLLKANGKNLVLQTVPAQLYKETLVQYKEVLGNLFGISVYPLRFNMKMRLTKTEYVRDEKGQEKPVQTSIFKTMNEELLATIQHNGCVVTDYKTFPLLEQKFWRLSQELLEMKLQGVPPSDLYIEHHRYLQRILRLAENKACENEDEFDGPNRPNQKILLDLGVGSHAINPFMIDTSIDIYRLLLEDKELGLQDNLQQSISQEMRDNAIKRAANRMAEKLAAEAGSLELQDGLCRYFLGQDEDVLALLADKSPKFKDRATFCHTQFYTVLPLTLSQKRLSRYARSDDGKRTVVLHNGDMTDQKFGTVGEQVDYTIQDYLQGGITAFDLTEWLKDVKQRVLDSGDQQTSQVALSQFKAILPDARLDDIDIDQAVKAINSDIEKVIWFLKMRLSQLKSSGTVIAMGPQECIDMKAAVSGTSATVGKEGSVHSHFRMNKKINGKIQASMVYRLAKRAKMRDVLHYDPQKPRALLQEAQKLAPIGAIIDGNGTYNDEAPTDVAKLLLSENSALKQVGVHTDAEHITVVGNATGNLYESGFVFVQSQTRGTDIPLRPDVTALLTLAEQDGLKETCQKEGRLRISTQKFILALSEYLDFCSTIDDVIVHAVLVDAKNDAGDIYKTQMQTPSRLIRKNAKTKLVSLDIHNGFLDLFAKEGIKELFISPPETKYSNDGDYHAKHCHIKRADTDTLDVLVAYKEDMQKKAAHLGLDVAKAAIEAISYSKELIDRMPEKAVKAVGASEDELDMELEVEQEQEVEQEEEIEIALEADNDKAASKGLGWYPVRVDDRNYHSVQAAIHPAYDPKIRVEDTFLPLSRKGTASLRKRDAFDEAMFPVGLLHIAIKETRTPPDYSCWPFKPEVITKEIASVTLGDFLSESHGAILDLRTNRFISQHYSTAEADVRQLPGFTSLIAQIKFFDGQVNGYTREEVSELTTWLKKNDPAAMKEHLLHQILKSRYKDKLHFEGSQLDELLRSL